MADQRRHQRDARERLDDHEAIVRLADELLPSLIAKLGATGLGEIEVREDDWRVRLRRPADGVVRHDRRSTDRPTRAQPGLAGHGHAPGVGEGHRAAVTTRGSLTPVGPGADASAQGRGGEVGPDGDPNRAVATSPAVGIFQPRPEAKAGTRVRSGDRLGHVDMLGVPQEVVAPVDGIIGASLVAAGEAVEYGQELIRIELAAPRSSVPATVPAGGPDAGPGGGA